MGSRTLNTLPRPGPLSTVSVPPWRSTVACTSESPRPVPCWPFVEKKGSRQRCRTSSDMPVPVSLTSSLTSAPSSRARTVTVPPSRMAATPLQMRVGGDVAGHLAHPGQPLLLEHRLLSRLQLDERLFEHPMALLQGGLRAVTRGDVVEADDHAGQLVALDHGRAHVVDRDVATVHAAEDLVGRVVGLAVLEGRQDR